MIPTRNFLLPTMYQDSNTGMNIPKEQSPDSYNKVRGRLLSLNSNISRNTSIFSMKSFEPYYKKIRQINGMDIDNEDINIKDVSLELSYEITQKKKLYFSMAAEN